MEKTKNILIVILALICAALLCLTLKHSPRDSVVLSDTTRVVLYDTLKIIQPVPKDSMVIRYVTELLPIQPDDSVTLAPDSARVIIPISQQTYSDDSTFTAWVSGYHPRLDSIQVYPRTETITITTALTPKHKRFALGLHVGYGITPRGPQPYLGLGISYTLFSF